MGDNNKCCGMCIHGLNIIDKPELLLKGYESFRQLMTVQFYSCAVMSEKYGMRVMVRHSCGEDCPNYQAPQV